MSLPGHTPLERGKPGSETASVSPGPVSQAAFIPGLPVGSLACSCGDFSVRN